ncbi:hypothetical protein C8Q73DRAFT_787673 [Cubamyces lactineus]|nr:hypothetical protein C8Q73DRAFT_787673 [Cubamyces lactineus]
MQPRALLPSLYCPLCSPPALLRAPVTLHCGHSFCAAHFPVSNAPSTSTAPSPALILPSCPLESCSYSSRDRPSFARTPPLDVTVNKLIDIILSLPPDTPEDAPLPSFHDDRGDCTGTEDEVDSDSDLEYLPLPPLSPDSNASHPPSSPVRDSGAVERVSRPDSPRVNARHHSRPRSQSSPRLRPRKRRRRLPRTVSPPSSHPQPHRTDHDPCARVRKELLSELTCEICFGLLWQPITTPCQHTFCTRCLFRSLDHSQTCPLCRQNLPGYDYFQQHPCNKVILAIILKAFPDEYAERGATIEAEERDARLDTPIFVCQLSFPGIPTMLHFFEPRYRLMLRRCLDSPHPCFGMIPPPRAAPSASAGVSSTGNDYGTMLAIRNVRMYPDGRSLVETWGTWRFRIMERGTLDGYMVARVERIEDYEEELDESAAASAEPNERSHGDNQPEAGTGPEVDTGQDLGEGRPADDSEGEQVEAAVRAELGADVAEAQTASSEPSSSRPDAIPSVRPSHDAGHRPGPSQDRGQRSGGGRPRASPGNEQQAGQPGMGPGPAAPSPPAGRVPTNAELMDKCRAFVEQMRAGTPWVVEHLDNNFVPMPNDAASFSFWMALLLPIDEYEKAKLLPIRSPRLRLRLVVHWIEQLNNNW